jgi:hypothetical protein
MSLNWQPNGANNVPSYQSSGIPFVTQSSATEVGTSTPVQLDFPYVTRFFTVQNIGSNPLQVGFTVNGVKGAPTKNYFTIENGTTSSIRFELRCKSLFFLGSGGATGFEIVAGLTTIPTNNFPTLTGSAGTGFEGVG